MDASESVSHACAEAAGTAGPVYTTGSIFNTKNMSVTGAHFIRTFFFFFLLCIRGEKKVNTFKKVFKWGKQRSMVLIDIC